MDHRILTVDKVVSDGAIFGKPLFYVVSVSTVFTFQSPYREARYIYCPPTKLREGNIFTGVRGQSLHHGICRMVGKLSLDIRTWKPNSFLVTSGGDH